MSLKSLLQRVVNISPVMDGREQIKTEDILGKTLTITAMDMVEGKDPKTGEQFNAPVFNFAEYPHHWYRGGSSLTKLANAAINEFSGDIDAASDALAVEAIQIRLSMNRKRDGQPWVSVHVID